MIQRKIVVASVRIGAAWLCAALIWMVSASGGEPPAFEPAPEDRVAVRATRGPPPDDRARPRLDARVADPAATDPEIRAILAELESLVAASGAPSTGAVRSGDGGTSFLRPGR